MSIKRTRDGEPVPPAAPVRRAALGAVAHMSAFLDSLNLPPSVALTTNVSLVENCVDSLDHEFKLALHEYPCTWQSRHPFAGAPALTDAAGRFSRKFKAAASRLPSRDEASYASLSAGQVAKLPKWEQEYRIQYLRYCDLIARVAAARSARIAVCVARGWRYAEDRFPPLLP